MVNQYKKLIMKLNEYEEVLKQYEQLKNHEGLRDKVSYKNKNIASGYKRVKVRAFHKKENSKNTPKSRPS